jgi:DNA-binding transcriptional MerR regulator
MDIELWTLADLADRVAGALSSGYDGQQSRRVSDVPDTRAIRYYTTLGLLDRPAEMRGRTAYYGPRHLWQLVAIKRLQADGRTLAEIQQALAAAPDSTLKRLADIPDEDFWRRIPTAPPPAAPPLETPLPETPLLETPLLETPTPAGDVAATTYQAVPLSNGTIVLIPRTVALTDHDVARLRAAAGPLDAAISQLLKGQS